MLLPVWAESGRGKWTLPWLILPEVLFPCIQHGRNHAEIGESVPALATQRTLHNNDEVFASKAWMMRLSASRSVERINA